ncbi:unnamed protein product [Sphagnum tenellum]
MASSGNKKQEDRIKELLGNGLSNEVVASTMGLHPSYISQLMSDQQFYDEVVEKRTKTLAAHTVRDRSLDKIEDKLIEKLDNMITSGMMYKHQDILNAFRVVNSAKRRGVTAQEGVVVNNTVVNLSLPERVATKFVTNRHGEIVEAAGKTMVTIPTQQLLNQLIEKHRESKTGTGLNSNKYEAVKRFLPASQEVVIEHDTRERLEQESTGGAD